ncbi:MULTISPECIES: hypothetical protein [Limnospira]|nr:hypothetical protein [Limnospira maxima]EKD06719.1 hypothetical protein SPLC1_S533130 [Arthrospira platensis C1]
MSHRKCDRYLILRNPVSYQNLGEDTEMVVETRFLSVTRNAIAT